MCAKYKPHISWYIDQNSSKYNIFDNVKVVYHFFAEVYLQKKEKLVLSDIIS